MERLNRVARKQTVRLTHYGRKSRKPYEGTVWFVVDGERVQLGTANVNRQWVRNVQTTPQVRLLVGA
jgi:F420H(2)-dependent quinone reductase